ncbi:hypothetical protein CPB83DRAFT_859556 [Crepidotus variabilis]|uniref:Glycosyltransferase 61 catalytic domain-containing protein n=1 Tax=Crepidotus variabilis TaxID=179855 RepID=A0A9P6EAE7_9AGAR|nr:hypothetical protein CPB83DRAFT_859556 [Crepidotus variabilis]
MPPLTIRPFVDFLLLLGLGSLIIYKSSKPPQLTETSWPNDDSVEDRVTATQNSVAFPRTFFTSILHTKSPAGFWMFSKLYLHKGTIYAVAPTWAEKESYPDLKFILAQPKKMGPESSGDKAKPTEKEMVVLTADEAKSLIGALENAELLGGLSIILYDVNQFMAHYYHWWGELMLGTVKSYSAAISSPPRHRVVPLEPSQFITPHVANQSWRDRAGVNKPLMQAAFPGASVEDKGYWDKLQNTNQTFVFEQAMIVSRIAAHKHPLARSWGKMIGSTMNTTVPLGFWEPLRRRVVQNMAKRGTNQITSLITPRGRASKKEDSLLKSSVLSHTRKPLVLYISRQATPHRRLRTEDDEDLIRALEALDIEGVCEFQAVKMEKLNFQDQIKLIARSTVLIGLHGNGLTHQIWMPSSPQSTIIEIFYPKMYLHDYEMLALNVGHKHYAVWNDTFVTYPEGETFPGTRTGPELHSVTIPVQGQTVAQIVRERLATPAQS